MKILPGTSVRKAVFAALASTFIATSSCGDAPRAAHKLVDVAPIGREASQAYEARNWDRFIELYAQMLLHRPQNTAVMYNLACGYALKGEAKLGLQWLKKIVDLDQAYPIEKDPDLDTLSSFPEFQPILVDMRKLLDPIGEDVVHFTLPEKDLLTEGIAYDPRNGTFYIGSVRKGKIVRYHEGSVTDMPLDPNARSGSIIGMQVDVQANALWFVSTALPQLDNFKESDKGRTAVFKCSLDDGRILGEYKLSPQSGASLGDLSLDTGGAAYVSDSRRGGIHIIRPNSDSLEVLIPSGTFISPQGHCFSEDGLFMFVADYSTGIYRINLKDKSVTAVSPSKDASTLGIDGLYFHEQSLIGIQNGIRPNRVTRFHLSDNLDRIVHHDILLMNSSFFNEPTLGVRDGSVLYFIANSQWNNFTRQGQIRDTTAFRRPVVLRLQL